MSERYCAAGNIKCEYSCYEHYCDCFPSIHFGKNRFEVCPWPSRQKPIVKPETTKYREEYLEGYHKGRADAVRECLIEVGNCVCNSCDYFDIIIAAIRKVGEK